MRGVNDNPRGCQSPSVTDPQGDRRSLQGIPKLRARLSLTIACVLFVVTPHPPLRGPPSLTGEGLVFTIARREDQGLACGLGPILALALSTQFTPKMPLRYPPLPGGEDIDPYEKLRTV